MKESYLNSYNQKRRSQSNAVKLPYIERRKREKSFQTDNKSFEIQPLNKKRNDNDKQIAQYMVFEKKYQNLKQKMNRDSGQHSSIRKLKRISTTKKKKLNKIDSYRFQTEKEQNDFDYSHPHGDGDDIDSALENFKRNVSFNKELIHKQINSHKKQSSAKKTQKETPKHKNMKQNPHLFSNIKKIISGSIPVPEQKSIVISPTNNFKQNLSKLKQSMRLMQLIQKIKKLNPEKTISEIKKINYQQSLQKYEVELKNQDNYTEWRKLDVDGLKNSQAEYTKSCFDAEHKRLSDYVQKNEKVMRQFIENRDQLARLKSMKVKTSIS